MIHGDEWWYPYCSFAHARKDYDDGNLSDLEYAEILHRVVTICNKVLTDLDSN
jgi:hypothetical protein